MAAVVAYRFEVVGLEPGGVVAQCVGKNCIPFSDTLAAFPGFMFPGMLAGEQCTSDALAAYHSSLVPQGGSVASRGLHISAVARQCRHSRLPI